MHYRLLDIRRKRPKGVQHMRQDLHASYRKRDATNDLVTRPHTRLPLSVRAPLPPLASGKDSSSASSGCKLSCVGLSGEHFQPSLFLYLVVEGFDKVSDFFEGLQAVPVTYALHNLQLLLACTNLLEHLLAALERCTFVFVAC
ncbi:hypothetical protein HBH98_149820 [Parastagonospora nodorum]|nr:hypothetical protein HBI10_013130 [Parastagonospora nodorum]KAH4034647.1 hypothetical protein HBI09_101540 [Parastagonospora nodorum]KAH4098715.1 hypothetical protein HBH46_154300 [Parastagonospora nodorum]KAH4176931.1 hypothetical protein HBH43_045680 [Parastagonospora nodorum]KAH4313158.1 hypothetical protein HBI01_002370 [Parastagonospora nodorum]